MRQELFNAIRRLDILQELIEDSSITEIMINGPDNIFIERGGKVYRTDRSFVSKQKKHLCCPSKCPLRMN